MTQTYKAAKQRISDDLIQLYRKQCICIWFILSDPGDSQNKTAHLTRGCIPCSCYTGTQKNKYKNKEIKPWKS